MRSFARVVAVSGSILFASGCSDRISILANSDGVLLNSSRTAEVLSLEDTLVYSVGQLSGINVCAPGTTDKTECTGIQDISASEWNEIAFGGLRIADLACKDYLRALFWFDRAKDRAVDQIGLVAVATAALIALTGGTVETSSIVTAGLGLAGATVENVGSGLLYEIGPSAIYEIVEKNQIEFRKAFVKDYGGGVYQTRARAMWVIMDYRALCTPPVIETEVRRAVESADVQGNSPGGGLPPTVGQQIDLQSPADETERGVETFLLGFVSSGEESRRKYYDLAVAESMTTQNFDYYNSVPIRLAVLVRNGDAAKNSKIAGQLGYGG